MVTTNITMTATSSKTMPPTTLKTTARIVAWEKAVGEGGIGEVTVVEPSVERSVVAGVESVAVARYKQIDTVCACTPAGMYVASRSAQ